MSSNGSFVAFSQCLLALWPSVLTKLSDIYI